jgi:hypothetical protein
MHHRHFVHLLLFGNEHNISESVSVPIFFSDCASRCARLILFPVYTEKHNKVPCSLVFIAKMRHVSVARRDHHQAKYVNIKEKC